MKTRTTLASIFLLVSAAVLMPESAQAHAAQGDHVSIAAGLGHPFSGLDHVLVMIAIGLWAAQLGRPAVVALPVAFPLVMMLGAFFAVTGISLPAAETGIALSAIFLGAAVLLRFRADLRIAVPLIAVFGLCHGFVHGSELRLDQHAVLFAAGFVVGTALLHATGIALNVVRSWRWGRAALRGAGAGVLASGVTGLWAGVT
jgi:urease accessory protein